MPDPMPLKMYMNQALIYDELCRSKTCRLLKKVNFILSYLIISWNTNLHKMGRIHVIKIINYDIFFLQTGLF